MTFLVVGTIFLAGRYQIEGQSTGLSVWGDNGGLIPNGALPLLIVVSGVVFAYAAVELVGTAAGETEEPEDHPEGDQFGHRAHRDLLCRLGCAAVAAAALHRIQGRESPFVTFFNKMGLGVDRRPDEHGRAHRRVLQPERRTVLDGPHPAVDGEAGSAPGFTTRMSRTGIAAAASC